MAIQWRSPPFLRMSHSPHTILRRVHSVFLDGRYGSLARKKLRQGLSGFRWLCRCGEASCIDDGCLKVGGQRTDDVDASDLHQLGDLVDADFDLARCNRSCDRPPADHCDLGLEGVRDAEALDQL